jgi:hypothetical protein
VRNVAFGQSLHVHSERMSSVRAMPGDLAAPCGVREDRASLIRGIEFEARRVLRGRFGPLRKKAGGSGRPGGSAGVPGTVWGPHVVRDHERPAAMCSWCTASRARILCLTCGWGSRGRRFKSCQSDDESAGQSLNPEDSIKASDISEPIQSGAQMVPKLTALA